MQPVPGGEPLWAVEGARKSGEEAPRREAERVAKIMEAEAQQAREAAEHAARERELREAGERAGREAAEREAAARASALRCVVPRLIGDTLTQARRALGKALCSLGKVTEPHGHHGRLVVNSQGVPRGRRLSRGRRSR